jgi:signal transduction histidine kinase
LRVGIGYAFLQLGTLAAAYFLCPIARSAVHIESPLESVAMASMMASMLVALYLEIPTQGLFSAIRISMNEQEELDQTIAGLESETQHLARSVDERTEGLREANQSLARLSASLSHDLRAPLRSISEFAKTLSEQDLPESVAPQLQGIGTDVESLQLILEKTMRSLRRETGS